MPRLPLASRDDLLDELAEIERDIQRCELVTPVSDDAAVRRDERRESLLGWKRDLEDQLAEKREVEAPQ